MSNVINLADRRLAASERRYFHAIATDIRAGVDVLANVEELEAIVMHTCQSQLKAAGGYLLAQYDRAASV